LQSDGSEVSSAAAAAAARGAMGDGGSSRQATATRDDVDSAAELMLPRRLAELRNQLDYLRNVYSMDEQEVVSNFLIRFKRALYVFSQNLIESSQIVAYNIFVT
jgi:hypothetical protein